MTVSYSSEQVDEHTVQPAFPLHGWRLDTCDGRQTWHYDPQKTTLSNVEAYWLGIRNDTENDNSTRCTLEEATRSALRFITTLQTDDGHWAGEYGGPMFIIPGQVIVWYISGCRENVLHKHQQRELIRYLRNRESYYSISNTDGQSQSKKGGWGIHIESPSTVFGTVLNYTCLRLLGVPRDDSICIRARAFLKLHGGALAVPAWGKFWLATLNCFDWEGMNPVSPETWLFPYIVPVHPGRMWIHTRMVYLSMSYFYGNRLSAPIDDLIVSLRQELFLEEYASIDWSQHRNTIAEIDRYVPTNPVCSLVMNALGKYERWLANGALSFVRKRALAHVKELIYNEDDNTDFLGLAPINKAINMLVVFYEEGANSKRFQRHADRVKDCLWMSKQGMMMCGTNGSQLWDTAFYCQAAIEANLADDKEFRDVFIKALRFLDITQIKRNPPKHTYRHNSKGAWPFSTRDQSYTVSDTTAEGLKTVLLLQLLPTFPKPITNERLFQAVDILLSMQNSDGGFASYELIRGSHFLELLNPAEVFGSIMTEYSYVECTTACILGLTTFQKTFPRYRTQEIESITRRAINFIRTKQRVDGSWYGSWAVCFTYAAWFSLEAFNCVHEHYDTSDTVRRACHFLAQNQRYDGGWGESYKSCETQVYVQHEQSQVVNTCWAVMALMIAQYPDEVVIRRGIELILTRQCPSGEWKQEGIEGVFNKNCTISYPNYKLAFPVWAIGRYIKIYGNKKMIREKSGKIILI